MMRYCSIFVAFLFLPLSVQADEKVSNPIELSCEGKYFTPNSEPWEHPDFLMKIFPDHIQLINVSGFPRILKISKTEENRLYIGTWGVDGYLGSISRFTGEFVLGEFKGKRWIRQIEGYCKKSTQMF